MVLQIYYNIYVPNAFQNKAGSVLAVNVKLSKLKSFLNYSVFQ